jgi:hypothetical protein
MEALFALPRDGWMGNCFTRNRLQSLCNRQLWSMMFKPPGNSNERLVQLPP